MFDFPFKTTIKAFSTSGVETKWTTQSNSLPPIICSIPPEFQGAGEAYTPEHLFAMAVTNCIIAMFKVLCSKSNLTFKDINAEATVSLDKDQANNILSLTEIFIRLNVTGASDKEQIKQTLDNAIKSCPVGNSIKTGKTFQINIKD